MDLIKNIKLSPFKSVSNVAKKIGVLNPDLFHYASRRFNKISKKNKRLIKIFCQERGWEPKPKPRKAPECLRCSLQYPTRKNYHAANIGEALAQVIKLQKQVRSSPTAVLKLKLALAEKEFLKIITEQIDHVQTQHTQEPERVSQQ